MSQAASYLPKLQGVTIFTKGAQVNRQQQVNVPAGESTVSFTGLSPYVDFKSLQVQARGAVTILDVSHRFVRPDSSQVSANVKAAQSRLDEANRRIEELMARRQVLNSQLEMVKTNCSVAGRTAVTPLEGIKQLNQYYYDEMMAIKKKIIALDDQDKAAREDRNLRQRQLDSISGIKMKTLAVVDVKVSARQPVSADFRLSYYTDGASWYPTYDIRTAGTNQPLTIASKAHIMQNTRESWPNAAVTLSTSNPNRTNVMPTVQTYWLDYGLKAPDYGSADVDQNHVEGTVSDENGEPIISATLRVLGTHIGTATDVNGHYSLTLPQGNRQVQAAYVGYESQTRQARGNILNFSLQPDDSQVLSEVVVTGYGKAKRGAVAMAAPAAAPAPRAHKVEADNSLQVTSSAAKFGYEYKIANRLNIPSSGKPVTCSMGTWEVPATYSRQALPRADKSSFIVADATGWRDLNLVQGEATVYFDNSYVGQTILDPTQLSDTLHLSLGRDPAVTAERKLVKTSNSHKFFGNSQSQTREWQITVHNTHTETVELLLIDQIPVSRNAAITVEAKELSGGKLNEADGKVQWQLILKPGEVRRLTLTYQVKWPKGRPLTVE